MILVLQSQMNKLAGVSPMQSNVFSIMLETQYQLPDLVQLAGTCGSGSTVPAAKVKMSTVKVAGVSRVKSDFSGELLETQDLLVAWKNPEQSGRTISLAATTSLSPSFT